MAKLYAPANRRLWPSIRFIVNRGLHGENGIHALPTGRAALVEVDHVAERDERPDEAREIEIELRELPDRHAPINCHAPADVEDEHVAEANQKLHERTHRGVEADEREVAFGVLPVEIVEDGDLGVLLRVGAHDAHAGKILLRARGNVREELLYFLEA